MSAAVESTDSRDDVPPGLTTRGAILNLFLDATQSPTSALVVSFDNPASGDAYAFLVNIASDNESFFSRPETHFVSSSSGQLDLLGKARCSTRPDFTVTVDVLIARGKVDTNGLTVDRNFWRRFAIDVAGTDVGCGLGSVRGRFVFDVSPDSFNDLCGDAQLVGDAEPPPPGVEDAGLGANGDDASAETMPSNGDPSFSRIDAVGVEPNRR